ncbi:hypothetical protein B0T10DRAFT_508372 [Thelonectria olida]|uniref:Uncharacterized protein n=1 Tax=Thelonectria olida TaxID=1576542 RepID=A0A9P9APT6_9HYPO|nr:hypothetical protein B0T10DRAFT_508372 [Thelonectria olida]
MSAKMESGSQPDEATTPKLGAPKDKNCPFCGQAFTSSSLGRHLDLYIKEKNPKQPDGVHDVEAIKKLRGNITRRQARPSLGARRASTPASTPKPSHQKEPPLPDKNDYKSPAIPREGQYVVDNYKHPFQPTWEATGVMNDIPRPGDETPEAMKRPGMQRSVSKQVVHKAQFDVKQKLSDAMDTARAAELALRELLSSWRAARLQLDTNSMPFEFDPFSLDFPALTLHCLQPPPTLFSSTQHPTSTSWSVQSPGQREFEALRSYFRNEFDSWKMTCASATSAAVDDSTFAHASGPYRDPREAVRKAEESAENLEAQVGEHLQSAYNVWESLPEQRRQELWVLELARSVGRKGKEMDKLKQEHHKLKQENSTYKSQIEDLCRLQQPREFKIAQPMRVPMEKALITALVEQGVRCGTGIGGGIEDSEVDLGSIVSKSIERWKNVITSTRVNTTGMNAQRSLDQPTATAPTAPMAPMSNGISQPSPQPQPQKPQQQQPPSQSQPQPPKTSPQQQQQQQSQQQKRQQQQQQTPQQPPLERVSTTSTNGGMTSEQTTGSTTTTAPPSIEETSDQDADAEMEDDDSFAIMNTSPAKVPQAPMQPQATLEVPRTRGPIQRANPNPQFMMPNGTGSPVARAPISLSRSMPNMNMTMQNSAMHNADMGMAMQGVRAEPMYME